MIHEERIKKEVINIITENFDIKEAGNAKEEHIKAKEVRTSISLFDELIGLKLLGSQASSQTIKLYWQDRRDDLNPELPVLQFFYRYPPFEPLQLPSLLDASASAKNVNQLLSFILSGSYVWFIKTREIKEFHWNKIRETSLPAQDLPLDAHSLLLFGSAEEVGARKIKLLEVIPIDLCKTGKRYLLFKKDYEPPLLLVYGTKKIKDYKERFEKMFKNKVSSTEIERLRKKIKEEYLTEYESERRTRKRGRAYDPFNLTYAWVCEKGIVVSTDPWDLICPVITQHRTKTFKEIFDSVSYCKYCKGRRYWRRRRIFPKFYVNYKVRIYELEQKIKDFEEDWTIDPIISITFIRKSHIDILIKALTSYIGYRPIYLRLENDIVIELPSSNVIVFLLAREFLKEFITNLVFVTNPKVKIGEINGKELKVSLLDILSSKYLLYRKSRGGKKLFKTFQRLDQLSTQRPKIIMRYREKFVRFLIYTLLHSLAHEIFSFIVARLEIPPDLITYTYTLTEKYAVVAIIENVKYGDIGLIEQFLSEFGNIYRFINDFSEYFSKKFKKHEEENSNFLTRVKASYSSKIHYFIEKISKETEIPKEKIKCILDEVLSEFRQYYLSLLNLSEKNSKLSINGVVIDTTIYRYHLFLSRKIEEIIREAIKTCNIEASLANKIKGLLLRRVEDILSHIGLYFCLDGCTSCLLFERYCQEHISQILSTSKWLLRYFIYYILSEKKFKVKGSDFFLSLVKLAKRRIYIHSPFISDKALELLLEKVKKSPNIEIILSIRKSEIKNIKKNFSSVPNIIIKEAEHQKFHEKVYLIDDVMVFTSWNFQPEYTQNQTNDVEIVLDTEEIQEKMEIYF